MTHATQKKERVAQNVKAIYLQPSVPRLNRCRAASGKKTNNKKKKSSPSFTSAERNQLYCNNREDKRGP